MAISALATEAKATALITAARTCIAKGSPPSELTYGGGIGQFMKDVIDQLESATVNDLSGRTNVSMDHKNDGRNTTEAALGDA